MAERWALYGLLTLLSAETFIGSYLGSQAANVVIVAPLALLAYSALVARPALSAEYRRHTSQFITQLMNSRAHSIVFVLFLLSFALSFPRAVQFGTLDPIGAAYQVVKWGSVVTILFSLAARADRARTEAPLLRALLIGWALYAGLNLALLAAGVQNSALNAQYLLDSGTGSMFSLMGLDVRRLPLPISGGLNTSGLQVAAGVPMGVALFRAGSNRAVRVFGGVLACTSLLGLLISDSRGGMLGALAGSAIILLPRVVKTRARWLPVALPFLPLLLLLIANLVQNEPWAQELQRGSIEGVGGALTGRPLIWGTIVLFLSSFRPTHLFGFGALGQLGSGVSVIYSAVFSTSYSTAVGAGAHNTLLQSVLDVGYIGALLQLLLFWHLLSGFGRPASSGDASDQWSTVGLAATVALVFIGLTGETLSIVTPNTLVLFLALNIHCLSGQSARTATSWALGGSVTPDDTSAHTATSVTR